MEDQIVKYEQTKGHPYVPVSLDDNTCLPERPLIPARIDQVRQRRQEIEFAKKLKEMWQHVTAQTHNTRRPTEEELEEAKVQALQKVPTRAMKRNAAKKRTKQKRRLLAAAAMHQQEEGPKPIPTIITRNWGTQTKMTTYEVTINNPTTSPTSMDATTSTENFEPQPSTSSGITHSSASNNTIFPSYIFQPDSLRRAVSLQDFQTPEEPTASSSTKHRQKSRKEAKRAQETRASLASSRPPSPALSEDSFNTCPSPLRQPAVTEDMFDSDDDLDPDFKCDPKTVKLMMRFCLNRPKEFQRIKDQFRGKPAKKRRRRRR